MDKLLVAVLFRHMAYDPLGFVFGLVAIVIFLVMFMARRFSGSGDVDSESPSIRGSYEGNEAPYRRPAAFGDLGSSASFRSTGVSVNSAAVKRAELIVANGLRAPGSYRKDEDDVAFEHSIQNLLPGSAYHGFHIKVAGTSHRNDNGTSRAKIIRECKTLEWLQLAHQPANKFDSNAIAVKRQNGDQLGYLDSRLAGQVVFDTQRYGNCWSVVFCKPTHHPDTGRVVGGVLYMIRFEVEVQQPPKFGARKRKPKAELTSA